MRDRIVPLLWLLAFAIIIGASMGALAAVANAMPPYGASPPGCVYPNADWRNGCNYDYQPDGSHMRCEIVVFITAYENCFPVPAMTP